MIKICHLWQNILKIFSLLSGFKKADYKPFNQWIFISRQIAWETVSLTRASLIIKIKNRHIMFHHITLLFKTLQYFLMPYRLNIFWTLKLQYNLDSIFFHILLKASLRHYPFVQIELLTGICQVLHCLYVRVYVYTSIWVGQKVCSSFYIDYLFLMEKPEQTFWPTQYTLNNQNYFHGPHINFLLVPALDLTSNT